MPHDTYIVPTRPRSSAAAAEELDRELSGDERDTDMDVLHLAPHEQSALRMFDWALGRIEAASRTEPETSEGASHA